MTDWQILIVSGNPGTELERKNYLLQIAEEHEDCFAYLDGDRVEDFEDWGEHLEEETHEYRQFQKDVSKLNIPGFEDRNSSYEENISLRLLKPILTHLAMATQESLVVVEFPEMGLHPSTRFKLADIFLDSAFSGVKIAINTYDGVLVRAIETLAQQQGFPIEKILFSWLEKDCIQSHQLDDPYRLNIWKQL